MDRLTVVLKQRSDWARMFNVEQFGLFVRGDSSPDPGSEVRVDLTVQDEGLRIIFKGQVQSVDNKAGSDAGCHVSLSVEDREKVNFMNAFVRGGLLNRREMRRLPLRLPVVYGGPSGECETVCRDINEEGMFLLTEAPLAEGTSIDIDLTVPGEANRRRLVATVTHTVVVEDEDVPGMGVTFKFKPGEEDVFVTLIDELEDKFYKGALPDDVIT